MTTPACPECHDSGTITRLDYRYDPPVQTTACECRRSSQTIPAPAWDNESPTLPDLGVVA